MLTLDTKRRRGPAEVQLAPVGGCPYPTTMNILILLHEEYSKFSPQYIINRAHNRSGWILNMFAHYVKSDWPAVQLNHNNGRAHSYLRALPHTQRSRNILSGLGMLLIEWTLCCCLWPLCCCLWPLLAGHSYGHVTTWPPLLQVNWIVCILLCCTALRSQTSVIHVMIQIDRFRVETMETFKFLWMSEF